MHSDIKAEDRVEIINGLRAGEFDVLIGISLLREGLDIPEASLVAILDADRAGFLRSAHALIQMIGRVARNENGKAILYADAVTPAMKQAIDETNRRRQLQIAFNEENGISPASSVRKLAGEETNTEEPTVHSGLSARTCPTFAIRSLPRNSSYSNLPIPVTSSASKTFVISWMGCTGNSFTSNRSPALSCMADRSAPGASGQTVGSSFNRRVSRRGSVPRFPRCVPYSVLRRVSAKLATIQRRPAFHQIPLEPFPEWGHAEADRRTTPMPEVLRSPALARASRWQCRGGHVVRQLRERDPGQRRSHFHVGIVCDESGCGRCPLASRLEVPRPGTAGIDIQGHGNWQAA